MVQPGVDAGLLIVVYYIMAALKYTENSLREAAENSDSVYGIIRYLDGNPGSGGTYQLVKRKLAKFEIDTSHFPGMAYNAGKPPTNKIPAKELLVHDGHLKTRHKASRLRRSLLEIGRVLTCTSCELGAEWNGQPIVLQVDHINNNWRDNRAKNLRFLCPNCHSQVS